MGGISAIINAIALIFFILFVAGITLVVIASSQRRSPRGGIVLAVLGVLIGIVLTVIAQGVVVVEPQQVAVIFNTLEGNLSEPKREGTHIVVPILQEATIYNISKQEYTMSAFTTEGARSGDDAINARTNDGQTVDLDVTVIFAIDPLSVNQIHRSWQTRYVDGFVRPQVRNLVRNTVSNYDAEAIYGIDRDELEVEAEEAVRARFAQEGLILDDLLIREINFSTTFVEEIESKVTAEQRQQRALTEARTAEIEAEGQARAAVARANGDAQAALIEASAQAQSLALISAQIAANPSLIQYEYIQNLGDNVSLVLIPSNSPYLFDFNSLQDLPDSQSGFNAPDVPELDLSQFETEEPATPESGN